MTKSLACSYGQGSDGRRGRSSSSEVQALSEKVDQYQRFFDILRTIPAADAVRILHHLRSPQTKMSDSLDSTHDAALAGAMQFAESLASRSSTPDGNLPPSSPHAWRQPISLLTDSPSTPASSDYSVHHQAPLASPIARGGNAAVMEPQYATISVSPRLVLHVSKFEDGLTTQAYFFTRGLTKHRTNSMCSVSAAPFQPEASRRRLSLNCYAERVLMPMLTDATTNSRLISSTRQGH